MLTFQTCKACLVCDGRFLFEHCVKDIAFCRPLYAKRFEVDVPVEKTVIIVRCKPYTSRGCSELHHAAREPGELTSPFLLAGLTCHCEGSLNEAACWRETALNQQLGSSGSRSTPRIVFPRLLVFLPARCSGSICTETGRRLLPKRNDCMGSCT